ncbi:MAG: NAD(P)H-hydrate dehydratase [Clostridia bacterium]|nr:NAD(P)H-hydrate dehydratase [Clostridia bacterium]
MVNCGVDIIEISRIEKAVKKNKKFLDRVFSKGEIDYFRRNGNRMETLAGFYAAKEAFLKYKKCGIKSLELSCVSVEHGSANVPFIVYKGARQSVSLSISHHKTSAVAVVCGNEFDAPYVDSEMGEMIPKRRADAHKGNCGRVLVIAGSRGMTGAAVLAAKSALRSGSGLVTVAVPKDERIIVASMVPEIITVGLDAENGIICCGAIKEILAEAGKADAVVFGPGLSQNKDIKDILFGLLTQYSGKLVIDADGLNALKSDCEILKEKKCQVVITPHPGEMARLLGVTTQDIAKDRCGIASRFAKEYGVTVVLKGKDTVVADENGDVKINPTGNPGMATAGMGDVLSGVIASFLGQGLECFDAAVLGAYIHGKAGDLAKCEKGIHGLIASDVLEKMPLAIKSEVDI